MYLSTYIYVSQLFIICMYSDGGVYGTNIKTNMINVIMRDSFCNTLYDSVILQHTYQSKWYVLVVRNIRSREKNASSEACEIIHVSISLLGKQIWCSPSLQLRLWKWLILTLEVFAFSVSWWLKVKQCKYLWYTWLVRQGVKHQSLL